MTSSYDTTPTTLSVSQLNRQARSLLESHFDFVWVEGEISNFAVPSSGHWYFSLKDGSAQVRCAMFRNKNQRLKLNPNNGDAVRLRCRVSLYEGRGEFQLIVEFMEPAGAGALQAAFERLKTKLADEGLFDGSLKKAIPESINHLGVITSPTGAAIHDILTVLKRRCPGIAVSIIPVVVQGQNAAPEISSAIARVNRWQLEGAINLDALIVGRGGGSLEDLWAFNEEIVARAISNSDIPIVGAVGHEIDFTIADMVADARAATPSAAAEMLSPDQAEWQNQLRATQQRLQQLIRRKLSDATRDLESLRRRLRHPGHQLREQSQRLDDLEQRLHSVMQHKLEHAGTRLAHLGQMLDSLSPLRSLQRGYAILTDANGSVVTDAGTVGQGDSVQAVLAKGRLHLRVDKVGD